MTQKGQLDCWMQHGQLDCWTHFSANLLWFTAASEICFSPLACQQRCSVEGPVCLGQSFTGLHGSALQLLPRTSCTSPAGLCTDASLSGSDRLGPSPPHLEGQGHVDNGRRHTSCLCRILFPQACYGRACTSKLHATHLRSTSLYQHCLVAAVFSTPHQECL